MVGQDAAEFNFHEFRDAKIERLSRLNPDNSLGTAAGDEVLLEDEVSHHSPAGGQDATLGGFEDEQWWTQFIEPSLLN